MIVNVEIVIRGVEKVDVKAFKPGDLFSCVLKRGNKTFSTMCSLLEHDGRIVWEEKLSFQVTCYRSGSSAPDKKMYSIS